MTAEINKNPRALITSITLGKVENYEDMVEQLIVAFNKYADWKVEEHSAFKEQEDKTELLNMIIALKYHYGECSKGRNTKNINVLDQAQKLIDKHTPLVKK